MIDFKFEDGSLPKSLTLLAVKENEFFVDNAGNLCQKVEGGEYNIIADSNGEAYSWGTCVVSTRTQITRIIGLPEKIVF